MGIVKTENSRIIKIGDIIEITETNLKIEYIGVYSVHEAFNSTLNLQNIKTGGRMTVENNNNIHNIRILPKGTTLIVE